MAPFKKLDGIQEMLECVCDRETLLSILKKEFAAYSIFDLMKIHAYMEHECKYLPPNYKKIYKEKLSEQIFCNFKNIISDIRPVDHELDINQYQDFLKNFQDKINSAAEYDHPQMTVLYYLCAIYNIFITQTPPHPEGTPFPGGFFVEKVGGDYYCPVKDKQEDNNEALCRFCVAKQTDI